MKIKNEKKIIMEELGRRLKSRRIYLSKTQKNVADHVGVTQRMISYIESGIKSSPRIIRDLNALYDTLEHDAKEQSDFVDTKLKQSGYLI